MPNKNLVSNLGFSKEGLHTKDENSIFSEMEVEEITEIIHPEFILADREADFFTSKLCFSNANIFERLINKVLRMIKKLYEV